MKCAALVGKKLIKFWKMMLPMWFQIGQAFLSIKLLVLNLNVYYKWNRFYENELLFNALCDPFLDTLLS